MWFKKKKLFTYLLFNFTLALNWSKQFDLIRESFLVYHLYNLTQSNDFC